jgi:hypothetical protein
MNWLFDNWYIVVGALAVIGCASAAIYKFIGLPNDKQKEKIKEWLVWACVEAEKALQSGTGQLKLREVWNKFCQIPAFSAIAKIITFDEFSAWVTDALKTAKEMLVKNKNLAAYVYGDSANEEIAKLKEQLKVNESLDSSSI